MKIIKEGKIPERETKAIEKIYRTTCKYCGCEFECYEDETTTSTEEGSIPSLFAFGAGRYITIKEYRKVKCPFCSKENILETKTISSKWEPWLS